MFSLTALLVAAVCVRLGFWQLSRLGERRGRNAVVAARLRVPEAASLGALPSDTAASRFRRVRLVGRFDYAHEVAVMARSHEGSPGVHVVTPLRLAGAPPDAPAVLVNRGWAYSPNGATVTLERWREKPVGPDSAVTVAGFVDEIAPRPSRFAGASSAAAASAGARSVLWLDDRDVARRAGYAVTPFVVLMQNAVPRQLEDSVPVRLAVPGLDEGPHLNYALQWFSFAAISLGGLGLAAAGRRGRAGRWSAKAPPLPNESAPS